MADMRNGRLRVVLVVALWVGTTAWAGPSQLEMTVNETHRRVVKLNRDLDASVEKLNQTTRQLLGRVNDTDGQARRVRQLIEDNQRRIESIEGSLTELRSALFAHFNITDTVGTWTTPADAVPEVQIEPPTTAIEVPGGETPPLSPQPAPPVVVAPTTKAPPPVAPTPPITYGDPSVAYQKGVRTYADGDYALAYDHFRDYAEQYPQGEKIDHVNWWMAMCLLKQAKYQQAITAFEEVRRRFPNSDRVPFAMQNQAVAHASLGQISKAEALLEAVIEQYPVTPPAAKARQNLRKLRGEE